MNQNDEPLAPPITPDHELPPEPASEAAIAAVAEELRRLQAERDALNDRLLRSLADADNARKRAHRELQEARLHATLEAIRPFLTVLDGFERAAAHPAAHANDLRKGMELLHRQLLDAARKAGLEPVESLDHPFDPHLHEALEMVDTDAAPDGTVVEELQRGYKLRDRLLRPAMVKVARGKS
ncbi:MAG TPA: nucleotide exchange factor GrpE [Terriglobales bacterium]|nr:nucleotide exchange factor GrpE [Terriglobales bacterium]